MKKFNITGACIKDKHFMVDISEKLEKIINMINEEEYFTINRARQYGKTTTLSQIYEKLKDVYLVVEISFEGMGDTAFLEEKNFIETFIELVSKRLKNNNVNNQLINEWEDNKNNLNKFEQLSSKITKLIDLCQKDVILLIDEVDKSSNNQLFLNFLGMLRNKYIERGKGYDRTFKSIVLAGVYDVKNLKIKYRNEDEKKLNSPWNIAADFDIDMSFSTCEISSMLVEYENDRKTGMDINIISEEIHKFTKGYPFLVSKLCKIIDEKLVKDWSVKGIENAIKLLLEEKNTLFDDLIKNLENNSDLFGLVYNVLVNGMKITFNIHNPVIDLGVVLGILYKKDFYIEISNKIFELCIYNYMISKRTVENGEMIPYEARQKFIKGGELDMETVLNKFQEVMKEEYRERDSKFIEREGRLLFLCFLKPIINGIGFYYVEAETRMDNRMDIIITYGYKQYIVELKLWRGEVYEEKAIDQISRYIDIKRESKGYVIFFSFNKNREYF